MTAIKVTRCDGRDSTDVRYPPICAGRVPVGKAAGAAPNMHYVVLKPVRTATLFAQGLQTRGPLGLDLGARNGSL